MRTAKRYSFWISYGNFLRSTVVARSPITALASWVSRGDTVLLLLVYSADTRVRWKYESVSPRRRRHFRFARFAIILGKKPARWLEERVAS